MPNYRNKSKIVKREELVPPGKLEEGMVITFRYNTGSDKTPVVLVIYYDRKKKMIEGINLNYITISRVGRLVELMGDAKVGIDKDEMIDEFEKDITRIQLSSKKRRDNPSPIPVARIIIRPPIRSKSFPAKGKIRLLRIVPIIYVKLSSIRLSPVLDIRYSLKTPTPIVCPGILASMPKVLATIITQP